MHGIEQERLQRGQRPINPICTMRTGKGGGCASAVDECLRVRWIRRAKSKDGIILNLIVSISVAFFKKCQTIFRQITPMHTPDPSKRAQEDFDATAEASLRIDTNQDSPSGMDAAQLERHNADWDAIAAMPAFNELLARKARFIVPVTVFFLAYYFALPVLVGWFPALMERRVGPVNIAYLFALSQFVMAWVVAGIYVKVASGWDRSAQAIIKQAKGK